VAGEHDGRQAVRPGAGQSVSVAPPRARRAGLTAIACVTILAACHRAPAVVPPPPDQRSVLLNPAHPFWSTKAPDVFSVRFEVTQGEFFVEVHRAWAPLGADRFYNLVRAGYFDDSRFFRVVAGRFAQFGIAGDPAVTAVWKDRAFADDSVRQPNVRGAISFAMTGPNARTTQLFINLVDNHRQFDAQGFAPIGRVVEGMEIVDALYSGYGENAGGGVRAGKQGRMIAEGNAHLDRDFPKLDRLIRAVVR
jgi:peptidyl-prolyl cis-trans isomerase A (cyclophilin A)